MKLHRYSLIAISFLFISEPVFAEKAPLGVTTFNVTCPAKLLLPELANAYQGCEEGQVSPQCDRFVELFRKLIPAYDCQRPFDSTPTEKYVVPAIWLAGDGELEKYLDLLSRLKSKEAVSLFSSNEFRSILDGHYSEEYEPLSRLAEQNSQSHK